jgi:integrase
MPAARHGTRAPATRGPPTIDEIVAVKRHAGADRNGWRLRAVIVVLWRAGLRVQEALALTEHDLDRRRGSVLVCSGKSGRRREVGMDEWGWEQLRSWLSARAELPVGPLFCVIDGTTRGRGAGWPGCAAGPAAAPTPSGSVPPGGQAATGSGSRPAPPTAAAPAPAPY